MNSAEDFDDVKFIKIDGMFFRLDCHYDDEADMLVSKHSFNYNGLSFRVLVQNDEQHDLISDYIWRMDEDKERKIKAFHRCNCFAYDIKKLKFDGMTIKDHFDVARFYTYTKNRYWAPYKDNYTEEEIAICRALDEEYEQLYKSLPIMDKYNL